MSLVKCSSDIIKGIYGDLDFRLKVLYNTDNVPVSGAVYVREKQNLMKEVELSIEIKELSKTWEMPEPINVDFKPLNLQATKMGYEIQNLKGFLKEVTRNWKLVTAIRRPDDSFLGGDPAIYMKEYPELRIGKNLKRLPENKRKEIRKFLTEKGKAIEVCAGPVIESG